ncbi:MAG: putative metal-binding motif-containing protein [Deltaproteobacteria bacterium]|nr:putative metal-binding motif-containing protein [Deltaproteobacteria bacterium]
MKNRASFVLGPVTVLLFASPSAAAVCTGNNQAPIAACTATPTTVSGNTLSGVNGVGGYLFPVQYGCAEGPLGNFDGPEASYRLNLTADRVVSLHVAQTGADINWDVAIVIAPEITGDCGVASCLVYADNASVGSAEDLSTPLPAGVYYILVDGYFEKGGPFDLTFSCETCTDVDGDGAVGYDAAACPSGPDCCDTGSEGVTGCSAATRTGMRPTATEVCGDGVDQDCDGWECNTHCMPKGSLACGSSTPGDTRATGHTRFFDQYVCAPYDQYPGPEDTYTFTPAVDSSVFFRVTPQGMLDPAILILEDTGGCVPGACVAVGDSMGTGQVEELAVSLQGGKTYYVVIDGFGADSVNAGAYLLEVVTCGTGCADADGDGFLGYDSTACPTGTDCCDLGGEASIGCSAGSRAETKPDADEVCGDGVDNDCNGYADDCPNCRADQTIGCGATGTVDVSVVGSDVFQDYCYTDMDMPWTGPEVVFAFTPVEDTVARFTTDRLDVFALSAYGRGDVCDPGFCVGMGGANLGGGPATFMAEKGETYFFAVDGYRDALGTVAYDLDCFTEACGAPKAGLACGGSVSGDTAITTPRVSIYGGVDDALLGAEEIYTFVSPTAAAVTLDLTMATDRDLALLVLEDAGAGCSPARVIGYSDTNNVAHSSWTESVTFMAAAGVAYYVVVDSYSATAEGSYQLRTACAAGCDAGLTACEGRCQSLTSRDNCGVCYHQCLSAQRCEAKTCTPPCDVDNDAAIATLCGGDDCDDGNAGVHQGVTELCNGVDDNCNGATDEGEVCDQGGCSCGASGTFRLGVLFFGALAASLARRRRPGPSAESR